MSRSKDYTTGEWKGLRQWKCSYCRWDTLKGEGVIIEHIRAVHQQPAKTEKVKLPLVDARGEMLVIERVVSRATRSISMSDEEVREHGETNTHTV